MPRVCIGLPVHNGENYLAAAIESILGQSFEDFELIISDNASIDSTGDISRSYARHDARVRYVRQSHNLGAIANYNAVFGMADCEYFKWAAHDDLLAPRFLEECIHALDGNPSTVLASPRTMLIDDLGEPLRYSEDKQCLADDHGRLYPALPEKNSALASRDPVVRFDALVFRTFLCVEIFGLIRKSVADRIPRQRAYLGSDKVFLARLCLEGPFWMGSEPLFFRRCHAQQFSAASISGRFRARWFGTGSSLTHGVFAEKLAFWADYIDSVNKAPLTLSQRFACTAIVTRRAMLRGQIWWRTKSLEGLYRSNFGGTIKRV